jgi:hypothetical protein
LDAANGRKSACFPPPQAELNINAEDKRIATVFLDLKGRNLLFRVSSPAADKML